MATLAEPLSDPAEILRRAFEADKANEELQRQYTFHETVFERTLDKAGDVKETKSKTFDVTLLDGEEYRRLIARDGEALSAKEERKEEAKLQKSIAKMQNESAKDRRKRRERIEKEREEERKWRAEIWRAYDLTLEGTETIGGVTAYRVKGVPKPGWEPSFRKARFLGKIQGTMWISEADYGVLRVRAEVIDSMSFGLFLLKLKPGAKFGFEQKLNPEGVWLPEEYNVNVQAKVALVKGFRMNIEGLYSNYRKFSTESELIVAENPVEIVE